MNGCTHPWGGADLAPPDDSNGGLDWHIKRSCKLARSSMGDTEAIGSCGTVATPSVPTEGLGRAEDKSVTGQGRGSDFRWPWQLGLMKVRVDTRELAG